MQNITAKEFEQMIKDTLVQEFSTDLKTASYEDIYKAAAFNVRKIMSARQKEFMAKANGQGAKQIYYLCIEFLMGRSLKTNLFNLQNNNLAGIAPPLYCLKNSLSTEYQSLCVKSTS